ncbi:MAG TPA: DegT/DnrJ/EryC1/StrS family aminotransferase [Candidatus Acidoferrum sp.]|jgi:dTDP-4-amino-4,6-dideoxygalactose transaminase|nr:DegT/DnrJ/EryC1/StrS family aminotransferase [Candidatus Acidoferrum sp.]
MTAPPRPSMEMIPMLDLRAQFETIASEIRAAIEAVLTAQQFVLGPQGDALEREIAEACGARHGVGVASGTEALELGLHACGVKAGDEVIVPAFTFIATGSAVSALGARPVFADIEPATFNLDPDQLEALITPRTRAFVVVHLFGLAADMDPILAIAEKHGISVIEDNAQSFGATYKGRKTGSMGRLGCLSFYPSKNLGAYGDAGMIITSDEKLAARLSSLRNHGQTGQYLSTERGWNSRLDELQAAILRVKLRHLADWTGVRQAHARLYDSLLKDLPGIIPPRVPPGREHVYYLYTIRVEGRVGGSGKAKDRGDETRSDLVQQRLKERGVASTVYYPVPLHLQPLYALLGGKPGDLRVSERAAREVLSIPLYPELTREQIERVAQEVRNAALQVK